jgi:tetratricopeptide (TPR) repeat protein
MDEKAYLGAVRPKWWAGRKPVIVIIVMILVAGAVGFYVWHGKSSTNNKQATQNAQQAAKQYMQRGDYQKAYDALKAQNGKAGSKAQQLAIYDGLAAAAASQGKLTDALHYYQLKHQLAPDTAQQDAYAMASLYERANDSKNAIAQFNIAITYYKTLPQTDTVKINIAAAQSEIHALEKQP